MPHETQPDEAKSPAQPSGHPAGALNDEPPVVDRLDRTTELLTALDTIVNARPPLVLGIHGEWGTGKTSFMKALQALLSKDGRTDYRQHLREHGDPYIVDRADAIFANHPQVITKPRKAHWWSRPIRNDDDRTGPLQTLLTVWFNPWQHQFQSDPIFPMIDAIRRDHTRRWKRVNRRIHKFLTDPRTRVVGSIGLSATSLAAPGWVSSLLQKAGTGTEKMFDHFANFQREFGNAVQELTRYHGGKLVIFIDDLDRCEGEYAVRILEALKLHLHNEHCVFVLGCARQRVINALIKHKLGGQDLDPNTDAYKEVRSQAGFYLQKIIQVPMNLPPIYPWQFESFLRSLGRPELADDKQCLDLLCAFTGDNPRRLKRFLLWHDMEMRKIAHAESVHAKVAEFADNRAWMLKYNLLRIERPLRRISIEVLKTDLPPDVSPEGDRKSDDRPYADAPLDAIEKAAEGSRIPDRRDYESLPPHLGKWIHEDDLSAIERAKVLITLRADIKQAEEIYKEQQHEVAGDQQAIVDAAIRRAMNLEEDAAISEEDLKSVTKLDLSGSPLNDVAPLAGLTNLAELDLRSTQVADIGPLRGLSGLETLTLNDNTQVADLTPLKGLNGLETLILNNTQVADLKPLAGLNGLTTLYLAGTAVTDLEPLKGLTNLVRLDLTNTKVADLGPLKGLTGLMSLYLAGTAVADLGPLKGLSGLTELYLTYTKVADLTPLAGLNGLTTLYLAGTAVADLEPLKGLTNLVRLYLHNTKVIDLGPLKGLTGLETLTLNDTQVADLAPLAGLSSLARLVLRSTAVADLEPLKWLNGLTELYLTNTKVADEGVEAFKRTHPKCRVFR